VILKIAVRILINVGVVEKDLLVIHTRKGVADLAPAGTQRFNLSSTQDDSSLKDFEDMKIAAGFGIAQDVGHGVIRKSRPMWSHIGICTGASKFLAA
jgi:hypothetical protein